MTARRQDDSHRTGRLGSRLIRGVTVVLVVFAALCAVSPSAFAGIGITAAPTFGSPVTVGAANLPASLTITNTSTGAEATGTVTLCAGPNASVQNTCTGFGLPASSLLVTPSCGSTAPAQTCPAGSADPGVFQLSSTGTGAAGTACAGVVFTISAVNQSTGQVAFVPATTIALAAPGGSPGASVCQVNYTANVLKSPGNPVAGSPHTTADVGFAAGFSNVTSTAASAAGSTTVTVNQAAVPIVTQVSAATVPLGGSFSDAATLSPPANVAPTGTVTFDIYGPNNSTCTGAAVFTSTVAAGATVHSAVFTPAAAGTYRVIATYSGDANYTSGSTNCNDSSESVVVTASGPPTAVTGGAASVSNTEETIQGSVNPNGLQTGYTVEYGRTTSFGAISTVLNAGAGTATTTGQVADLTGLAANATYYYRLVATNSAGTATGSVMTFTTTGPGTKPTVTTGAASNITSSGATLSGTISPGGLQTGFTFEYGTTTTFGKITAVEALIPSGVLQPVSLPVSGLLPNTFYLYRLVATNSAGTTNGPVMSFTTVGQAG